MTQELTSQADRGQPILDSLRHLIEAGKQFCDAGRQVTVTLSELSERIRETSAAGSRAITSPWVLVGAALLAGLGLTLGARNGARRPRS